MKLNRLRKEKKKKGFTLVEVLLYVSLVAIFLTGMVYFAWDSILGNIKAGVHQEVQENIRFATSRLQTEIRNAPNINLAISGFGINLANNPGSVLALAGSGPYYPLTLRVEGGVLEIKRGAGAWTPLTGSSVEVTSLTFTDLTDSNSENVRFTITIEHRNPSGKEEWSKSTTFETSVNLR
jgi:type II secretory pathway pseudopilin PulG